MFLRIVKRGAEYVGVDAKMLENIVHLLVVTMQDSQHQVLCVHLPTCLAPSKTSGFRWVLSFHFNNW